MPIKPDPLLASIRSEDGAIGLRDFYALPETSKFFYMPTRALWPVDGVNGILPEVPTGGSRNGKLNAIKPSAWLKQFRRAEQMTWAPGEPEIIENRLISEGGWQDHDGARCLNLYIPPALRVVGDAAKAAPWVDHLNAIYPDDAEHLSDWFGHRVQRPGEKINHALLMGGKPGIGKDTLLSPVREAVGPWNFRDISPDFFAEPFNPFAKAVILQVNEARDLGDNERFSRYTFYEKTKIYAAAPPEALPCHEKFQPRGYVPNVVGLLITTNYETDGVYLPAGDRRHYVVWSNRTKEEFSPEYFNRLWDWLRFEGGHGHVAAYLLQRDLSTFDPHAPPRLTEAFYAIVQAGRAPEDIDLGNAIDELGRPDICSLATIATTKAGAAMEWLFDPKARRAMPHRMERCGYVACRNPDSERGSWTINDRKWTLYAKTDLSPKARLEAARRFVLEITTTVGAG
jgi:hypothetical protein